MIPQSQPKLKKNSSKVNLTISFVVHAVLVGVLIYFAAREGYLGKKLQKISVQMEKEKPKEKPPEKPKPETPKVEAPKVVQTPKVEAPKVTTTPPPATPAMAAPPATTLPALDFPGGAAVNSESDPVQLYKGYMEYELRSRWDKPDNLADDNYVVEVQVHVDRAGNLSNPVWQKDSSNPKWDDSVREVFKKVTVIDRPPPTNFPPVVTIRFDVAEEAAEPVLQ
jgi:outer membrane biosynthesis protein TonB